jgi:hypothetical protein
MGHATRGARTRAAGPGGLGGRTLGSSFCGVKHDCARENPFPLRVLVASLARIRAGPSGVPRSETRRPFASLAERIRARSRERWAGGASDRLLSELRKAQHRLRDPMRRMCFAAQAEGGRVEVQGHDDDDGCRRGRCPREAGRATRARARWTAAAPSTSASAAGRGRAAEAEHGVPADDARTDDAAARWRTADGAAAGAPDGKPAPAGRAAHGRWVRRSSSSGCTAQLRRGQR